MPPVEQDALIYGPIRVELLTHKVLAQGKFVRLAKMEYRLLCYLILHEGQVLSRQEILTNIWNLPPNVKTRTLDMHMLLTPVVLTWYIATELGSILENAAEMGAPVPPVLREVLEKVHKASDRKDTTASAGHQDE